MQFTCKAVGQSYFKQVIAGMVKAGYALVSNVEINSYQMPYHVPATFARSTNLFFHIIGKSVLVHLEYIENDTNDVYERADGNIKGLNKVIGYWTVNFWVQYKPYEAILKMTPQGLSFDEQDNWFDAIPLIGKNCEPLPCDDFEARGGMGYDSDTPNLHGLEVHESLYPKNLPGPCNSDRLVRIVTDMIKPTLPFADKRPIYRLYVGSLAPSFIFSGENNHHNDHRRQQLEQLFWSRMDIPYFQRIVYQPWGADLFDKKRKEQRARRYA